MPMYRSNANRAKHARGMLGTTSVVLKYAKMGREYCMRTSLARIILFMSWEDTDADFDGMFLP